MATRVVEGKKPYTGGKAISIDENKVISLNLRDENNLIIYDAGDDEIYVDLQLDDEITPTSAFPIGVNVGRVIVDNGWDKPGTIISAETTSGDNIKIFYADEGTLWIDNGTGTFKQIYFKADVDALITNLTTYINTELAKKQNGVASATAPSNPSEGDLWYDTTNSAMKVWDGTAWQSVGTGGGGSDIEYVTQAEYNALPSSKLTDGKHYFIYSTSGGGGWQPGANTIARWKLDGDALDYSGNSRNLTASGITYESGGPGQVGVFSGGATAYYQDNTLFNISYPFTYSLYVQTAQVPSGTYDGTNPYYTMAIVTQDGTNDNIFDKVFGFAEDGFLGFNYYNDGYYCMGGTAQSNTRYYLVYAFDGVNQRIYSNGTLVGENPCGGSYTGFSNARLVLASQRGRNETIAFNGKMSNVIIENKVRTAQEITDYFDQTKGDYGIS